jgi:hypothetical protein
MDKKNYDRKTLMVMDTIGSYLTHTVYNSLYIAARQSVDNGKDRTITDAYRKKLNLFSNGMSKSTVGYKDIIKSFFAFYQKKLDSAVTMREFEDSILSQFIPTDYYKDFSSKQRDTTMRDIFIASTENFFDKILKQHVSKIIDDHKNKDNVIMLQEQILDILLTIRETYYDKFAGIITSSSKTKPIGVPHEVVEKLKDELSKARKYINDLSTERDRAINMLSQTVNSLNSQKSLIEIRDEKIASLERQLLNSKSLPIATSAVPAYTAPVSMTASTPTPVEDVPAPKKMSITLSPAETDDNLFESDDEDEESNSWFS